MPKIKLVVHTNEPMTAIGILEIFRDSFDLTVNTTIATLATTTPSPDVILLELAGILPAAVEELSRANKVIVWTRGNLSPANAYYLGNFGIYGVAQKNLPVNDLANLIERVAAGEKCLDAEFVFILKGLRQVKLKAQEDTMLVALAHGATNKEIATIINNSEGMAKVLLTKLFKKVGMNSRTKLALWLQINYLPLRSKDGPYQLVVPV